MPHFSPSLAAISLLLPLVFTSAWAPHPLQQWTGKYVGSCTTLARRYTNNKCFDSSTVDSYVAFPMIVAITKSGSSYSWSYSTAPVSGPGWTATREEELLLPIKSVKRVGSRGSTYCMSVDYPNDDRRYSYTVTLRKQGSTQVMDLQYSQDWLTTSRVRHACLTSSPKVTCSERLHVQLKLCTLYKY